MPYYRSSMWLLLLSTLLTAFALGSTVPCACENGGTCPTGSSSFCACKLGWTGATCDQPYESCYNADNTSKCLNGGKCLNGEVDDFGNTQNYCDCDDYHTGKYCQHSIVAENDGCTEANQAQFCLNGGVCNSVFVPYVSCIYDYHCIALKIGIAFIGGPNETRGAASPISSF
jgi:hypothetical protein